MRYSCCLQLWKFSRIRKVRSAILRDLPITMRPFPVVERGHKTETSAGDRDFIGLELLGPLFGQACKQEARINGRRWAKGNSGFDAMFTTGYLRNAMPLGKMADFPDSSSRNQPGQDSEFSNNRWRMRSARSIGVGGARNGCEACSSSNRCGWPTSQRCSLQCPTERHVEKAATVEEAKLISAVAGGLMSEG